MRLLLVLALLAPPAALAQTAADKALVTKKAPAKPQARLPEGFHEKRLRETEARHKRNLDAAAKSSRERHKSAPNAIRNER
ncbi:MAG TPA: hypothetical protein VG873_05765 [Burkholderiales bacterium]|nr:hypothetical protein [Burkholderiales bacterium]